jgi:hypothetical protein
MRQNTDDKKQKSLKIVRRDEVVPKITAFDSEFIELVAQAKEDSDSGSFKKLGNLTQKSDFNILKSIDQVQRLR